VEKKKANMPSGCCVEQQLAAAVAAAKNVQIANVDYITTTALFPRQKIYFVQVGNKY